MVDEDTRDDAVTRTDPHLIWTDVPKDDPLAAGCLVR